MKDPMRLQDPYVKDPHVAARQTRSAGDAVSLTAALVAVGGMMVLKMGLLVTLVQNVSLALAVAA